MARKNHKRSRRPVRPCTPAAPTPVDGPPTTGIHPQAQRELDALDTAFHGVAVKAYERVVNGDTVPVRLSHGLRHLAKVVAEKGTRLIFAWGTTRLLHVFPRRIQYDHLRRLERC